MSKALKELESILCAMDADSLSDEQQARLQELIDSDIEARQFYLEYCQMHAMLQAEYGELGAPNREETAEPEKRPRMTSHRWLAWAAAIILALVGVGGFLLSRDEEIRTVKQDPLRGDTLGTFAAVSGCKFAYGVDGGPIRVGQSVRVGRYQMQAGIAEMLFDGGAHATIEAPADFRIGYDGIRLAYGRLVVETGGDCTDFMVKARGLQVTHIGTTFAVDVCEDSPSEVHVFEGEVMVKSFDDQGDKVGEKVVHGGEAVRVHHVNGEIAGIDLAIGTYIRGLDEYDTEYAREMLNLEPALYFPMRPTKDGRTLVDLSPNGCDAEIRGGRESGVLWSPGQIGMAIRFEGPKRRDYALIKECDVIRSRTFTVMAWVYAESRPRWASIMKHWAGEERGFFHFGLYNYSGVLEGHVNEKGGTEIFVKDKVKLPLNQWQHVAFVVDDLSLRLYRNGVLVDSARHKGIEPDLRLKAIGIGAKPLYPKGAVRSWGLWHGKLDEIAFFNRPLDTPTIHDLYEIGLRDAKLIHGR